MQLLPKTGTAELTAEEAADLAKVSRPTIGRWCSHIPGLARQEPRAGWPRWLINTDKLMELIAQRERSFAPPALPPGTVLPKSPRQPRLRRSGAKQRKRKLAARSAEAGMTYAAAAKAMGVGYTTIRRWADIIPGLKVAIRGEQHARVDPVALAFIDHAWWGRRRLPRGTTIDPAFGTELEAFTKQNRTAIEAQTATMRQGNGEPLSDSQLAEAMFALACIEVSSPASRYRRRQSAPPTDSAASTQRSAGEVRHAKR